MYDPITAIVVITAVAAFGGAYMQYEQGQEQKKAYEANAEIAKADAAATEQKTQYDETAHRENVKRILSRQRALYGSSGVEMQGSPLLVMQDTAAQGEMDALAIRYGGDVEAARKRSEANVMKMQGKSAERLGMIGAGTTLLSGAGQIGRMYYPIK